MSRLSLYLSCLLFATPGLLIAQAPPKDSPFRKAQGPVAARPIADQPTELTLSGTMSLGGTIMVCITVVAEKRSHWIKVGESASRIEVLSHNQENGQVSIRYNGKPLTLELSKPAFNTSALSQYSPVPSGPLPVATVALDVPMTNAQKESEARYLVSDLLEIGIIQREAYKKAQGGTPPVEAPGPKPANP